MITVNNATNTALNTQNKATCDVLWNHGKAYTNIAGLILLEKGLYAPNALRELIKAWINQSAHADKRDVLAPVKVNGSWWFSVAGWDKLRSDAIKSQRVTSLVQK